MSPARSRELAVLRSLARLHGVQTSYLDMTKHAVAASAEGMLAVLQALGVPVESMRDAAPAFDDSRRRIWDWRLEPVTVAWGGVGAAVLRMPADDAHLRIDCNVRLEDGDGHGWGVNLTDVPPFVTEVIGGDVYVAKLLPLRHLPLGYHTLYVDVPGHHMEAHVISAPTRAYRKEQGKTWGVLLPIYSVPPRPDQPVATYRDFERLVERAAGEGASLVGSLPLLPAFLERPFDPSPYSPVSRLFWNELYVDAGDTPVAMPERLDDGFVPYREAMQAKRRALEARARRLSARDSADLERFLESKPGARDYARFRAAQEHLGHNWRAWPQRARGGILDPEQCDEETVRFYAYAQWQATDQLSRVASRARAQDVELYLDLPVGVHPDGYDAWRYQHQFVEGMSIGAPPDIVTTSGQDWGARPLHPAELRRTGYEYLIAYLRHHFSAASLLRIDHVMGLHRLYWVPQGAGARHGVYVRYHADEQYAVLCLESQRHQAGIVGENLGIVPDQINAALNRHGISRMYVMSIELTAKSEQPYTRISQSVVASFGTHDLPTFAAFWHGTDFDLRQRLGVLDAERAAIEKTDRLVQKRALVEYLRASGLLAKDQDDAAAVLKGVVTLLARSRSECVLVNLEDLWLESEAQNVPGTGFEQHPNWGRVADHVIEDFEKVPLLQDVFALLRELRPKPAPSS